MSDPIARGMALGLFFVALFFVWRDASLEARIDDMLLSPARVEACR